MTSTNDVKRTLNPGRGQPPMTALRVIDNTLAKRCSERERRAVEASGRILLDVVDALLPVCTKLNPGETVELLMPGLARLSLNTEGVGFDRLDLEW
jgi:hypothetical protein